MRTSCIYCACEIETEYGATDPAEHSDATGTRDDPRAPGDWDNICDVCNYRDGRQGGPGATA